MRSLRSHLYRLIFAVGTPIAEGATIRLGSEHGGWHIPATGVSADAVVYSGGLGEDASFDVELIRRFGCEVWVFDPTPRAVAYADSIADERFRFLPVGLWSEDGSQAFFPPKDYAHVSHSIVNAQKTPSPAFEATCRSLPTLMAELGHGRIDLLKLDIEGAEYAVLESVARGDISPAVLAVEFHPVSLSELRETFRLVKRLRDRGYCILAREAWDLTLVHR
jgi:FkbM family methyltransferase